MKNRPSITEEENHKNKKTQDIYFGRTAEHYYDELIWCKRHSVPLGTFPPVLCEICSEDWRSLRDPAVVIKIVFVSCCFKKEKTARAENQQLAV